MKKKIIVLLSLMFLLCGCTAEVNLEINENTISESVDIIVFQSTNYTKEQIKSGFRNYIPIYSSNVIVDTEPDEPVNGIKYYEKKESDIGTGYKMNYKYTFNINDYKNARTIKEGFRSSDVSVNSVDETILISTDSNGLLYFEQYPELEKVKINIKTSYKAKENNADSVSNNVYTWNINRGEKQNIYLLLDISKEESEEDEKIVSDKKEEKEEDDEITKLFNDHPVIVAVLAVVLFLLIIVIFSKFKR